MKKKTIFTKTYQAEYAEILKQYPFLELIYETPQSFIDLIEYSINKNKVQLIEDRILEIGITLGHQEKKISFVFQDQKPTQEELIDTLQSLVYRICDLERDNELLKKEVEKAFTEFGRKLKFHFVNPEPNQIEISNENQTIKKVNSNYTWTGVIANKPVYQQGKTHFEILVDQTTSTCNIMFGFTLKKEHYGSGYYSQPSGHMYYGYDGSFYRAGGQTTMQNTKVKTGDKIKAVFDASTFKIQFYVNDKKMGNVIDCNIPKSDLANFYPCVDLYDTNDKVSVI